MKDRSSENNNINNINNSNNNTSVESRLNPHELINHLSNNGSNTPFNKNDFHSRQRSAAKLNTRHAHSGHKPSKSTVKILKESGFHSALSSTDEETPGGPATLMIKANPNGNGNRNTNTKNVNVNNNNHLTSKSAAFTDALSFTLRNIVSEATEDNDNDNDNVNVNVVNNSGHYKGSNSRHSKVDTGFLHHIAQNSEKLTIEEFAFEMAKRENIDDLRNEMQHIIDCKMGTIMNLNKEIDRLRNIIRQYAKLFQKYVKNRQR